MIKRINWGNDLDVISRFLPNKFPDNFDMHCVTCGRLQFYLGAVITS